MWTLLQKGDRPRLPCAFRGIGDGVNVAARLEGIAEPGGICIPSSAYDQVRDKVAVDFADLGDQNLKNIARPVRAFAVLLDWHGINVKNRKQASASAPPLSIVVLPFASIGGDPEQGYFADGITEPDDGPITYSGIPL